MFAYLGITGEAKKKARELDIEYPSSSDDGSIVLKKQRTGDTEGEETPSDHKLSLKSDSQDND